MRLMVEGVAGELAAHPDRALDALVELAGQDGADRSAWLEKALHSAGVTHRTVPVDVTPRHAVIEPEVAKAVEVYRSGMAVMRRAIAERLDRAAREARVTDLVSAAEGDR